MKNTDLVTLDNLGGGAAKEAFEYELNKVLRNVVDPNTGGGVREITLKVKIKPDKSRQFSAVAIDCTSKLAPSVPFETQFYIGKLPSGDVIASEYNPQQPELPNVSEAKTGNVVQFQKEVNTK